jgi:hypothetical protein
MKFTMKYQFVKIVASLPHTPQRAPLQVLGWFRVLDNVRRACGNALQKKLITFIITKQDI